MIVNDEVLTLNILKTDISWDDYGIDNVYTAINVCDAKKLIVEKNIDIMLCDIEMPGENGIALLRWVREQNIQLECIFLTCHANFEYAKEAIMLECRNYILIPTDNEKIGEAVYKVVMQIREKREEEFFFEYGKRTLKTKIEDGSNVVSVKRSTEEIIREVIGYILQHIEDQELTVEKIAGSVFMHPVYLNRLFKKHYKISIGKFIVDERMKYAACLLKTTNLSMSMVAEKVGYSYYASFSVVFKKYYGITPTQYQRDNRDRQTLE